MKIEAYKERASCCEEDKTPFTSQANATLKRFHELKCELRKKRFGSRMNGELI